MKGLAALKGLRGTAFDPFRFGADRKLEQALIPWFETCLAEVAKSYSAETADLAQQVLAAPLDMRGYGPVKDQAVHKGQQQANAALAQMRG